MKKLNCYLFALILLTVVVITPMIIITPNINSKELLMKKINVGEKISQRGSSVILKYGGMPSDQKFSIVVYNLGMRTSFSYSVYYPIDTDSIVLKGMKIGVQEVTPNYIRSYNKK